jgi:hypothetical protein
MSLSAKHDSDSTSICTDALCENSQCITFRVSLGHYLECSGKEKNCATCNKIRNLTSAHARGCNSDTCAVPFCKSIKKSELAKRLPPQQSSPASQTLEGAKPEVNKVSPLKIAGLKSAFEKPDGDDDQGDSVESINSLLRSRRKAPSPAGASSRVAYTFVKQQQQPLQTLKNKNFVT